jgi:NAD(P)H-nitrite reductase large subunit
MKDILSEDVIICRCEEITEREIIDAIRKGATTVDAVKRMTRAGMGNCQSRSCFQHVARLLSRELGLPISEIKYINARPPIVPIPVGLLDSYKGRR